MLKNNIKTKLIDEITKNELSIICDADLAENIDSQNIRAVLANTIKNNKSSLPVIYNGDIRSVSLNQLNEFDGIVINVKDFSKQEITAFSSMFQGLNTSVIYLISNVVDIVKIRSLQPQVVVINQQHTQNPVSLKLNIDWKCSCLLNPLKNNVKMEYLIEYGFSGIYADRFINNNIDEINCNITSSLYMDKLYVKKSSIRPLLKASNITSIEEMNLCISSGIDMLGFLFDNKNKSNIIDMLLSGKECNMVASLEVYESSMLEEASNLINSGNADCIENHTGKDSYIANSYNIFSAFNTTVNNVSPVLVESVSIIEDNNITTPWLSFMESEDMMSVIKLHNVELIEFNIKDYNTKDKIKELIKKIKYKQ